jgi:hypothetical protein
MSECPACRGSGIQAGHPCGECRGSGVDPDVRQPQKTVKCCHCGRILVGQAKWEILVDEHGGYRTPEEGIPGTWQPIGAECRKIHEGAASCTRAPRCVMTEPQKAATFSEVQEYLESLERLLAEEREKNDRLRQALERIQEMAGENPDHIERAQALLMEVFDVARGATDV